MAANQIGFRSNLIATIIIFRLLSFFFFLVGFGGWGVNTLNCGEKTVVET